MAFDVKTVLVVLGLCALAGVAYSALEAPGMATHAAEGAAAAARLKFKQPLDAKQQQQQQQQQHRVADKVPVDLHVMSICPDAVFCENTFSAVLEQVGEIVELTTQYIAQVAGDSFTCKHGEPECEGNLVQLCARHEHPDPAEWFNFILCQDEDYRDIPNNTAECARRIGLNETAITTCADETGPELLRASIALTNSRSIAKSCSVVIDSQLVCIRDGGVWYSCPNGSTVEDFVRQICAAYKGDVRPAACK